MKTSIRSILALTLACLIAFSCCSVSFAATKETVHQYG